jgi:acetylornithine/succinyldiaminopimelate/putrescine aminotransferase
MFGFQHDDVVPDIMALSKHFGGGVPVSAVCTTDDIARRAVGNGFATRSHRDRPLPCAAGVASIDAIVEEDLPGRAAKIRDLHEDGIRATWPSATRSLATSAVEACSSASSW